MKKINVLLTGLVLSFLIQNLQAQRVQKIIAELKKSDSKYVLVVSHRGDWRNAPENSIQAIKNCIAMGVDVVEIDVAKTKDGHLVLMHDETIDRTTNGKGLVSDFTLDSLKKLYLKDGLGITTKHRIPALEEAMLAAKGQVMINLDKCYNYFPEAYEVLVKTGTVDHAIMKGSDPYEKVKKDFGMYLDKVFFMPIVRLDRADAQQIIDDYQSKLKPLAFEVTFKMDTSKVIAHFGEIRKKGARIWNNSLWEQQNAGHDDEKAVYDPEGTYGWQLEKHINMIQTDRPAYLIKYLESKQAHQLGN